MNNQNIQKAIRAAIKSSGGKVFTATFEKKDGTTRVMNGRLGVRKGVTGKGLKFNPEGKGLLPVFDMKKGQFRMINLATVTEFRCGKLQLKAA